MSARVIPPLAAISPGVAISDDEDAAPLDALFTLTAAQYTATSLPEAPPAAYNAGTDYAVDAECSRPNAGPDNALDVYASLVTPNIGHTPESSPTYWKFLGTTYPEWVAGTYAEGDRTIDAANHLEYRSLVGSNTAALTDETKWQLTGPTNAWRAVDVLRNTKAAGPSGTFFTITPGKRIDAIGLAGLIADSFTISLSVDGDVVWTHTEGLSTRNTLTYSDYFFGAFLYLDVSAIFDIPKYSGAVITITFARGGGDVSIGAIWINEAVYLGETETEPKIDRRNFSTIDRRADGTLVLVRRQSKPSNSYVVYCPKDRISKVKSLPDDLNAVPAMWVLIQNVADEYFDLVTQVAVYTRFTITPGHPDVRIDLDLEDT